MSISRKRETVNDSLTPRDGAENLTDVGNGRRLARASGKDLRYVEPWKKWLVWDGRRWSAESQLDVERRAKAAARGIYREAAEEIDDARRRELAAWAKASEGMPSIRAMIAAARSEHGMETKVNALDSHPFLLNVENGTVDLRIGQLRPHCRADMLTKLAPVAFIPTAEAPRWQSFLDTIFRGNDAMIGFMQRWLGYCLSGDVREQALPIAWGAGGNGKSTLVNTFLHLLGPDYSMKAGETLLTPRKEGTPANEVAELCGKRFVACIETANGRQLSENTVKEITGGDPLRGCLKYENGFNFWPTHKVWLATNHKPEVRGTDEGIWRRIKNIDFSVSVPPSAQDKTLEEKLRAELPGILAWCVRGCVEWLANGMNYPPEVDAATAKYRAEQDVIASFLGECCIRRPDTKARAADIYDAYKAWCAANGEVAKTQRQFGAAMTDRGMERFTNNGTFYRGVGIVAMPNGRTEPS